MSAKPTEETRPQVNSEDVVARVGEAIRNHLAQATEAERHRCVEQLAEWCSERERDRREEHLSRVARGIPAPSTYTPLCLPKEDAKRKGLCRSKESITKLHLRRWPNLSLVCLIAWIEGSCAHHSIREADISQCHGLSPTSRLEPQYKRVIAKHSLYIPMLEQDCRHVADRQNPRIVPLPYWEPQGPRKRCPVSTGVPQNLLPPCSQR